MAEVKIGDVRTVGVRGDARAYQHPAEITLQQDGRIVRDYEFLAHLSARITNEVKGINRVIYTLASRE